MDDLAVEVSGGNEPTSRLVVKIAAGLGTGLIIAVFAGRLLERFDTLSQRVAELTTAVHGMEALTQTVRSVADDLKMLASQHQATREKVDALASDVRDINTRLQMQPSLRRQGG